MKNKVFILGDSYSTYEGYIPDGYASYYGENKTREAKLRDVSYTWWHRYLKNTDSHLLLNCSYSGTTICHTGYDGSDNISRSFITRFEKLINDGFFADNIPDSIFIFGGTNDSWANAPLGKRKYTEQTTEDLYSVFPAIYYLFNLAKKNFPQTRIVCVINSEEIKEEIVNTLIDACEKYGIEYIEVKNIDKLSGHPTELGMEQIEKQIREGLEK